MYAQNAYLCKQIKTKISYSTNQSKNFLLLMRRLLLMQMALFLLAQVTNATEITYNLGAGSSNYGTGQSRNETYDVALRIEDPALVGSQVKGLRIYFSSADGISDAKAWLSTELAVKSQKFTGANIETVDFTATEGFNEVTFAQPYTITSDGLYVGYSLLAAKDVAKNPIRVTSVYVPEGFYIHSSGLYRTSWHTIGDESGSLAIEVILEGDFSADAATAVNVPEVNSKTNDENSISFEVMNQGLNGIESIDYTIEVGGQTIDYHTDLTNALPGIYGRKKGLTAALPIVSTKGAYDINVTVTKVNGQENGSSNGTGIGKANFYNILPVKRPVCEEYTGLWCQWCPRGFVGMELMGETYGDDFVGICFHNDDPMEIMPSSSFPVGISGYPSADVDRVAVIDPNFQSLQAAWLYQRDQFAPLAIDVETELEGDDFKITALVTSPLDIDNDKYQLQFIVTQDGMQRSNWQQVNAYAGRNEYKDGYMDWFCEQGTYVTGLVYNDVIIAWSGKTPIANSLPAHFDSDVAESYTYTFDLNEAVTTYAANLGQSLVQDKTKLKGVVLIIDTTTGEIVNANQAFANTTTSIDRPATSLDEVVASTTFFDMQGRRALNPRGGMFVKVETLRNGKQVARKVVMK